MSNSVISDSVFNALVIHLVDIEEEKDRIVNEYYPNITYERDSFNQLIGNYIVYIEDYISKAKVDKTVSDLCPFVTIGSIVEIEDMEYCETEKLKIVSPFINKVGMKCNCASFLSPMGRSLLLKEVNDMVEISTPIGKCIYKIKSIEIPMELY